MKADYICERLVPRNYKFKELVTQLISMSTSKCNDKANKKGMLKVVKILKLYARCAG